MPISDEELAIQQADALIDEAQHVTADIRYPLLIRAALDMPWAILPSKLTAIMGLLRLRAEGGQVAPEEIAAIVGAARQPTPVSGGAVAVVPIFGTIVQRAGLLAESSGAVSTERIGAAFRQAMADPAVSSVVLQIDSPGGGVYGVAELADTIRSARGQKPIVAVADSLAASAAYWIASAADEIVVTPSGEVGSIGVFTAHEDWSQAFERIGVGVSLISAGKYKTEGNIFEPLGDEARAAIQGRVDDYYRLFTNAVAKGRGVSADEVRGGFGQGRVVGAQEAVKLGMADRVATMDATVRRLAGRRGQMSGGRANEPEAPIVADGGPFEFVATHHDIDLRRRRLRLYRR